jgi:hypothetical protein
VSPCFTRNTSELTALCLKQRSWWFSSLLLFCRLVLVSKHCLGPMACVVASKWNPPPTFCHFDLICHPLQSTKLFLFSILATLFGGTDEEPFYVMYFWMYLSTLVVNALYPFVAFRSSWSLWWKRDALAFLDIGLVGLKSSTPCIASKVPHIFCNVTDSYNSILFTVNTPLCSSI